MGMLAAVPHAQHYSTAIMREALEQGETPKAVALELATRGQIRDPFNDEKIPEGGVAIFNENPTVVISWGEGSTSDQVHHESPLHLKTERIFIYPGVSWRRITFPNN